MASRGQICVMALVAAMLPAGGTAQSVPAPVDAPAPAAGFVRIPANTPVWLEMLAPISSKTSHIDDVFPIRLARPVVVDDVAVLPAGARGQGQVVHAAKARALGKAGELILAARYLDCGDVHVVLRGFRLGGTGDSHSGAILAGVAVAGAVGLPLMFMSGGEMVVPAGSWGSARLMAAVDVPAAGCPAPVEDTHSTPGGTMK